MQKSENGSIQKFVWTALFLGAIGVVPLTVSAFQIDLFIALFINIIVVVSFRFLTLTGEMSFCHVVMMGVGAYTTSLLSRNFDFSPWLTMPLGGIVAALTGYILSYPLFRMKGFYFVIGSFAAGEAIRLSWQGFRPIFGGSRGVTVIPTLDLLGLDLGNPILFFYFAFFVMAVCLFVMYRLEHSRFGLTLHAIHWQDLLISSVGVDTRQYRTQAFVIACFFAGIAGTLYAHYFSAINPRDFSMTIMLTVLVWAIVGGLGSFSGPIIGVAVLSVVDLYLRDFEQYRPLAYGLILIVTSLFLPDGLRSLWSRLRIAT
ncbi:MAG: branched-chain amino acid ABC transporter permease [Aestuariivirga sp.]|nr:branched-chain amino acid ABC transporter permease [Aestuariivirga sp.]